MICRTLALVKPDAVQHTGKILHAIQEHGFVVR
jgi:nucleoside diphosphate kinase